jgi:hypothetical protein
MQQQDKTKTVLGRLDNLEKATGELDKTVTSVFTQFNNQLRSQLELLEGVVEALREVDPDLDKKVSKKIDEKRQARLAERAEQEKTQLENLVTAGVLQATDIATASTVMVGRIFQPDGNVFGAGRTQIEFDRLNPETQAALQGQTVGFVHESEDKSKFEILEIYAIVSQGAQPPASTVVADPPVAPIVTEASNEPTAV